MHAAADRCQRIGACRKTGSGVMCPSYMATREEEHATRGRANALVKALVEPDPRAALGDERLHEILDLCLECKACKSECPLSVDMATLKSEFLSHYNAIHGTPLRSRLFGAIRTLNRLGSATAPLSNLPVPRAAARRLAGIDRRRPLPRFERETLIRWARQAHAGAARRGEVIFLADSFTTFTEPGVGRASIELLEAAGYDVRLESGGCCGRAASPRACSTTRAPRPRTLTERLAGRRAPITGCEPSCLLTLREEHVALLGDRGVAVADARSSRSCWSTRSTGALPLRGPRPEADPLPRPLPPEGARGHGRDRRAAAADPGRRGRRARRRLLRHGRVLRLRDRALRAVHAHRRDAPVPRGPERARGHGDRGHRRLMPPADRARDRAARAPPGADRAGRTR